MDKPIPEAVVTDKLIADLLPPALIFAETGEHLSHARQRAKTILLETLTAAQQQGQGQAVGEIGMSDDGYKIGYLVPLSSHRLPIGTKLYTAPPPSVPVGVEGLVAKWREEVGSREGGPTAASVHECADELEAALAQQPAAAWQAIVEACVITEAITPDEGDIRGTLDRLIDYHVGINREQQPAGMAPRAWLCTFGEVSGVTDDPKWRDMCARLGQQITPLVPAVARQPAAVDEAMVERACGAFGEEYGGFRVSRVKMRAALTAALATQHQEPTT